MAQGSQQLRSPFWLHWFPPAVVGGAALAWGGWQRFHTFHMEDPWLLHFSQVAAQGSGLFQGFNASAVLMPLAVLAYLVQQPVALVLLASQWVALACVCWPLARFALNATPGRTLAGAAPNTSKWGVLFPWWVCLVWWLCFPVSQLGLTTFHPMALGLPAIGFLGVSLHRHCTWGVWVSSLVALACHVGFAWLIVPACVLHFPLPGAKDKPHGSISFRAPLFAAGVSTALWIVMMYVLPAGSRIPGAQHAAVQHAGPHNTDAWWTGAPMLWDLMTALALLPLLGVRWCIALAPVLLILSLSLPPWFGALLSNPASFDQPWLLATLPWLLFAAMEGTARQALQRVAPWAWIIMGTTAAFAHGVLAPSPLSPGFDRSVFAQDARAQDAQHVLQAIPTKAHVAAPPELAPALLANSRLVTVHGSSDPLGPKHFTILDRSHRDDLQGKVALLRTPQEIQLRQWFAKDDAALVSVHGRYLVFRHGEDPRAHLANRYIRGHASIPGGLRLAGCLTARHATLQPAAVTLQLEAHGPCPADLAVRLGTAFRPERVDLLFDGLLSPAQLRRGDVLQSIHGLNIDEHAGVATDGLRLGAVLAHGRRPDRDDPIAVTVPLQ